MSNTKKKFKVEAKCVTYSYIIVEADSEDEALDIAEATDGGDFITTEEGYFEVMKDHVNEVK